ncbi:hypothetical protein [Methanogenium sp. MK-MG]|uniref:hypothetical protein n=1 Tax=Methanogenium sp. MK-MG TaxID=2599926 RepID=UPI0013EE0229|nr:hypothetical protein [Methanogenium sp. MK-MG]
MEIRQIQITVFFPASSFMTDMIFVGWILSHIAERKPDAGDLLLLSFVRGPAD